MRPRDHVPRESRLSQVLHKHNGRDNPDTTHAGRPAAQMSAVRAPRTPSGVWGAGHLATALGRQPHRQHRAQGKQATPGSSPRVWPSAPERRPQALAPAAFQGPLPGRCGRVRNRKRPAPHGCKLPPFPALVAATPRAALHGDAETASRPSTRHATPRHATAPAHATARHATARPQHTPRHTTPRHGTAPPRAPAQPPRALTWACSPPRDVPAGGPRQSHSAQDARQWGRREGEMVSCQGGNQQTGLLEGSGHTLHAASRGTGTAGCQHPGSAGSPLSKQSTGCQRRRRVCP